MNKLKILLVFAIFISTGFFGTTQSRAVVKSYKYDSIVAKITVNPDSTFDVAETQTFNFTGNFHFAFRTIRFSKIDAITDMSVEDVATGQPLVYSATKLDKEQASSWGRYTTYVEGGLQYIHWYFNLSDTSHSWVIKYKIHGGIEFNKEYDRLYWNIFNGYDVPIDKVQVYVGLPSGIDIRET
ncbi:MAG TPA: DUF2207 domain-containing protein, partial [Candidatus Saccharimonadales bacterium]|nr:DUF2207 domain-containing protein [Candidatus Saccharimonadales bacterium]